MVRAAGRPVSNGIPSPWPSPGGRGDHVFNLRRSIYRYLSIACLVLLAMHARGGVAFEPTGDELETREQKAFQAAVAKVAPSVVRIETVGGLERVQGVLFGTGPTTALVVDGQGYVVSSAFNFLNRPASILVRLPDGARKPAELIATDHSRMLVLLKIHADEPLPVAAIAPQSEMRVGQWAIAVGRTFEAEKPNLTVGILSALDRIWGKAIQTDAIVSPNNYGGPLVDIRGRVLGVIVPLSPQSADEVAGVEWYDSGIGFAIPAEHIQKILPRLKQGEDLYPGLLGISFAGSPQTGPAVIAACHPNSPAAKAGLKTGDKIAEIEGRKIRRAIEVKSEISRRYAGDTIHVVVLRDEKRMERALELVAKLEPYQHAFLGVLPLRAGADKSGVAVRYVYPGSPAADAGIAPGDVLVSMAGKPIADAAGLRERLSESTPEQQIEVEIRRAGRPQQLKLQPGRLPEGLPPAELPPARPELKAFERQRPEVGTVSLKIPELTNDIWAYVPEGYRPDVPHGVVVWLHAPGGFDQHELLARWRALCDRFDLILLAPKAADPQRWEPMELELVDRLLDKVSATYNVDRARIVVSGQQGGGTMAYLAAFRNRELVRAVAAVDAVPLGRPPDNDPLHRLAVYTTTAKKSGNVRSIEQTVSKLREMKIPVTVKDLGENPRDLKADELAELARWIDMLDRI